MAKKLRTAREDVSIPGILDSLQDILGDKREDEVTLKTAMDELANLFDMHAIKEKKKTQESFDAIWEFEPVGPEEFCRSEHYLGLGDQIYPVVMQDLIDCFPNPKELKPTYEEIIFDEAIGCLSGDTKVLLANGKEVTIEEMYKSGKKEWEVHLLNPNTLKLETGKTDDVLYNGVREVYEITLRSGRRIKLTDNHPLFTKDGWKQLKYIKEKDLIAVPRKIDIPSQKILNQDELKLLGYLIGDGSCAINGFGLASIDPIIRKEFEESFKAIETNKEIYLKEYYREYAVKDQCYGLILRGKNKKRSYFADLLEKTGLLDKKSKDKFIPWQVKVAPLEDLALFINRLWSTDGSVDVHKGGAGYGTASRQLAEDLQFCLSRFGIISLIKTKNRKVKKDQYKTVKSDVYTSYEVWVSGEEAIKFFDQIGFIVGAKEEKSRKCLENLKNTKRNTNIDVVPFGYFDVQYHAKIANVPGLYTKFRCPLNQNLSRNKLQRFTEESKLSKEQSPVLHALAYSDIFWDRVEKIEYIGEEDVYDLSVPGHRNFVANGIIVHNSGKSFKLSILATYMAYKLLCLRNPQKTFNLAPASKIAIMNMSVSASQAKRVVFGEIKNKIDFSPWFQKHYPPNPRIRSELQFDPSPDVVKPGDKRIYKNVYIIPGSSSGFAPLGYNLFCGIIDEATLWRDSDNKDYVQEVYEIIRRRVTSRFMDKGLIVLGGSPMYSTDFLERRIKAVKDEGLTNVLVRRRSHWDAKYPNYNGPVFYFHLDDCKVFKTEEEMLKDRDKVARRAGANWETALKEYDENIKKIPMMYYEDFKKNPEGSKRDLGGWPSDSVSSFIANPSVIQENINYKREDPVKGPYKFKKWFGPVNPKAWHTIHIDLGITGDACGIAMGHPEGFNEEGGVNVFIDFVMRIEGSNENPVQIEDIRQMIYRLSAMGFPIGKITMDGFQSVDTMQILRKKGYYVEYLSLDRSLEPYEEWKTALYEHRINIYEHPIYEQEARKLEKIKNKKIDHPRGGSKDLTDAVAGVVYNCIDIARWDPPTDDDELTEVLSF